MCVLPLMCFRVSFWTPESLVLEVSLGLRSLLVLEVSTEIQAINRDEETEGTTEIKRLKD